METCVIFEDYICKCAESVTIHANVPAGSYKAQVITPMGKVYETDVTTDENGSFLIPVSIFPDGLLNEYAGGFQVFLMQDYCTPVVLNLAHPGEDVTTEYDYAFFCVRGGNCDKNEIGCIIPGSAALLSAVDIDIPKFNDMGSNLKVQTFPLYEAQMSSALESGEILLAAIQVLQDNTFTGITFMQHITGDYTPGPYNGLGLYKSVGDGIIDLVATMADIPTAYQGGPGFVSYDFDAPYTAEAGLYFIAALYSADAVAINPAITIHSTLVDIEAFAGLFTDNMKVAGTIPGIEFPASIDMGDVVAINALMWAGMY